ncbi:MAG: SHOCT domain-containing protein [Acidimicrobiales bacterium]
MMDWNGESWGWGGWLVMVLSMLGFWALVAWVAVTVIRSNRGSVPAADPEDVLAERFARGEIDDDEYRRRLEVLRGRSHT